MLTHLLGKKIDIRLVTTRRSIVELDQGERLGGGRHRSDESWNMRTAEIENASLVYENETLATGPLDAVHLGTNLVPLQLGRA